MAAPQKKTKHGEDYLSSLERIEIRLENGEKVDFSWETELSIPDGPDEQLRAARKAPARLAFFAYQAERMLHKVRTLEGELAENEGLADLTWRKYYEEHTSEEYTEQMIRSRIAMDGKVKTTKINLNYARKCYGYLRALRDSLDHRVYVLNALVGQKPNANRD